MSKRLELSEGVTQISEKGIQAAGTSSTKGLSWGTSGLAREHPGSRTFC